MKLTPAALLALARGDKANYEVATTPGGIEAQEAAGQRDLCASAKLPKDLGTDRPLLEVAGVVFLDDADDLFVNVKLPKGWSLRPTEHSMWSDLIDGTGKVRLKIFYKAAFYDRSAHGYIPKEDR